MYTRGRQREAKKILTRGWQQEARNCEVTKLGVPNGVSVGARYREWRVNWTWMVVAGLLVIFVPLTSVATLSTYTMGAGVPLRVRFLWHVLYPIIYGIQNSFSAVPAVVTIQAVPGLSVMIGLTALGLGVALITAERNSGILHFTWMLTLPRRTVYEVKWLFGGTVLLIAMGVNAILLLGGDWLAGSPLAPSLVGQWLWLNTILALTFFTCGMAIGTVVGAGINAFLVAIAFLLVPLGCGEVLKRIFLFGGSLPARAWLKPESPMGEVARWLSSMSPFDYMTNITYESMETTQPIGEAAKVTTTATFVATPSGELGWWWILFAGFAILLFGWGRSWYQTVGADRYDRVVLVPGLWRWVHVLVALGVGLIPLQVALPEDIGVPVFLAWLLFSGVIWVLILALMRMLPDDMHRRLESARSVGGVRHGSWSAIWGAVILLIIVIFLYGLFVTNSRGPSG